jgi:hypothetical protein
MKAKPDSPREGQRVDYVRLDRKGKAIDKEGNFVNRNSKEAHPSMEGFEFKEELFND